MAQPVGIYNRAEDLYISFENDVNYPYFSGFLLRAYTPGEPRSDGRCIDTIVCDIIGDATTTWGAVGDALDKLRLIKRTLANSDPAAGHYRPLNYIKFWPVNALYATYSLVMRGTVSVPSANYLNAKGIISDVVITVEREGVWRRDEPANLQTFTPTWLYTDQWWNATTFNTPGDMPALVSLATNKNAVDIYRTLIVSYRSELIHPLDYNSPMIEEAESWTMGTDTAAQANGVASNGSVARCTFATTATDAVRVSKASHARRGTYRIFTRVWCDASTTVEFYMSLARHWGTFKGNVLQASASIPVIFDLGAFQFSQDLGVPDINTAFVPQQPLSFSVRRVSGAGSCYIDGFWMMPCDEGFLKFNNPAPSISKTSGFSLIYDTTQGRETFGVVDIGGGNYVDPLEYANGVGRMAFQPGAGRLQMIFGYENFQQSFSLSGFGISTMSLRYVPCYNGPFSAP